MSAPTPNETPSREVASLESLFDDDDDAEMMSIDPPNGAERQLTAK